MTYTPTTWVDETGVGDGTLVTAARLNKIEQGIVAVPGTTWRGVWAYNIDYHTNDLVNYGGAVWIAKKDNTFVTAPDHPDTWDLYADRGQPGVTYTISAAALYTSGLGGSADVGAGVWRGIPIAPVALVEPSDAFTVSANNVTVKDAGWYHVAATILDPASASHELFIALSTNAVPGDGTIANEAATATAYTRAGCDGSVKLAAGGKVYLHGRSANAGVVNVQCQNFSIERIGGPQGPTGPAGPTGGNATVPLDTWHNVGDPTTGLGSAFAGTWSNYGSGNLPLRFRKDPVGRVWLEGVVKGGASPSGVVCTLPAGYECPDVLTFPYVVQGGTLGYFTVSGNFLQMGSGANHNADEIRANWDTKLVTQMPTGPKGDTGAAGPINGVQDEGSLLAVRSKLNVIGSNIRAVDDAANDRINIVEEIPLVTALTAGAQGIPNPIPSGFMADLLMTAPDGTIAMWRFRYRPASLSSYKWECISGADIHNYGGNLPCASTSAYIDLSVVQNFVCPIEAEYLFRWGCQTYNTVGPSQHFMAIFNATANSLIAECVTYAPAINTQVAMGSELKAGFAVGTDIRTRCHTSGGSGQFLGRYLAMRPVRAP